MNWWLLGKLVAMVFVGVVTWLGLLLLGVKLALTLGVCSVTLSTAVAVGFIPMKDQPERKAIFAGMEWLSLACLFGSNQ